MVHLRWLGATPTGLVLMAPVPVHIRFWRLVDTSAGMRGCWPWEGRQNQIGYGMFDYTWSPPRRSSMAHRAAWELERGPIPDDLTLDHLCMNRLCVNPAHLEPVTLQENIARAAAVRRRRASRTHCPKGHPYSGDNLRIRRQGTRFSFACRECGRPVARNAAQKAARDALRAAERVA